MCHAGKPRITGLENSAFRDAGEVRSGVELVVAGQVHLAVLADDGRRSLSTKIDVFEVVAPLGVNSGVTEA